MKQSELQNAYQPVPPAFHRALLAAAQGESARAVVRKRRVSLPVAALVVALLCGTALALANYFSVRDYLADGQPNAAFARNVVALNRTYENEYLTVTIGDAVFDGRRVAMAMNLRVKDEAKPVYLFPTISGACGAQALNVDVQSSIGDFTLGFLYPNLNGDNLPNGVCAFDASIVEGEASGDVAWCFTLDVYAPNWAVESCNVEFHGDDTDMPMDEYTQLFRDAYAQRKILAAGGDSVSEYVAFNDPDYASLTEAMVSLGAFTHVDSIVCDFVTPTPEPRDLAVHTVTFDDYTAAAEVNTSFCSVSYRITRTYADEQAANRGWAYGNYELRDSLGNALELTEGGAAQEGCTLTITGSGNLRYRDLTSPVENLSSVTFVPQGWNAQQERVYDEAHAFAVNLADDK